MKVVPSIVEGWEKLREERKTEQPHVSDKEWAEIEARELAEAEENQDEPVPALAESG